MKNNIVTILCYGKVEKLLRNTAIRKYEQGADCCEGSERERYVEIYMQLLAGYDKVYDFGRSLTYHRPPTQSEISFGYGATHYCEIPVEVCMKNEKPKQWLVYKGQRWYR